MIRGRLKADLLTIVTVVVIIVYGVGLVVAYRYDEAHLADRVRIDNARATIAAATAAVTDATAESELRALERAAATAAAAVKGGGE